MKRVTWKLVRFLEKRALDIDPTTHFNPQKYVGDIDVKLTNYKTSRHQKYMANYHIVWVVRGRCKVLFHHARELLKVLIENEISQREEDWEILACEIMPEHIHMFVSLDHLTHPYQFVGAIRRAVTKKLLTSFPILEKALGKDFWNRSFYWGTIGNVTGIGVLRYISKQWEETREEMTKKYLESKNRKLTQFF